MHSQWPSFALIPNKRYNCISVHNYYQRHFCAFWRIVLVAACDQYCCRYCVASGRIWRATWPKLNKTNWPHAINMHALDTKLSVVWHEPERHWVCELQNRNGLALGIHACDSDRQQYPTHILLHIFAVLRWWQFIHQTLYAAPPSSARYKHRLRSWSGIVLALFGTFAVRISPKLPPYPILSMSSTNEYRRSTLIHDIISTQNEVPVPILWEETAKFKPDL
jgi:hypothetical protein